MGRKLSELSTAISTGWMYPPLLCSDHSSFQPQLRHSWHCSLTRHRSPYRLLLPISATMKFFSLTSVLLPLGAMLAAAAPGANPGPELIRVDVNSPRSRFVHVPPLSSPENVSISII